MRPQTLISALYGQTRGYRRLSIRREVAQNEQLPRAILAVRSDRLLREHVQRCIRRFPTYAERVKAHRGSLPREGEPLRLAELPIWTRLDQIEFFAAQERPEDSHYVHESGGSTAIMDRVYGWAGAEEGSKSLHIWGTTKAATRVHGFKVLVHRALQRRRYFNTLREFTDEERAACCEAINRMRPNAIVGYTGMLVDIARYAREHQALDWKAPTLISTAETLQCGPVSYTHLT